jgi:alkylresorcinol/alkylpyrone synthase
MLVPDSRDDLGFALTNAGFRSILSREVADVLAEPTVEAVRELLLRHELLPADVGFWLVHAGGPRILSGVEQCFHLPEGSLRWSWQTLRETGNTSSASIFEVLRRYMADEDAPRGWGVVIAFGPGVSIELLLVHIKPGIPRTRRCS